MVRQAGMHLAATAELPQLHVGSGLEHDVQSLLRRTADDLAIASGHTQRRIVRHRFARLYRRRRLRYKLGSGTLAAGIFAGGGMQLRDQGHPSAAWTPAATPAPAPVPPPAPAPAPTPEPGPTGGTASWTWDPDAQADLEAADPGVTYAAGVFHVYTTSATHCTGGECRTSWVPRFTSPDLSQPGRLQGDAMPSRPDWVAEDDRVIWAPAVAAIDGRYVMYFAATSGRPGDHSMKCLGAAVSSQPEGPFVPLPEPLHCVPGYWTIDPYPVLDGGRWYLVWREDDGAHTTGKIVAAPLSAGGLTLAASRPMTLLVGESDWEDGQTDHRDHPGIGPIENPAMVRHPVTGDLLLTWSANLWETQSYATGLAQCDGPLGPCHRLSDGEPWLGTSADPGVTTDATFGGAGGLSFVVGPDGQLYALMHAYRGSGHAPEAPRVAWAFRVEADADVDPDPTRGQDLGYHLTDIVGNQSPDTIVNRP